MKMKNLYYNTECFFPNNNRSLSDVDEENFSIKKNEHADKIVEIISILLLNFQ